MRGRACSFPQISPALVQIVLIGNSILMLYPIVIMALGGFKTTGEIFANPFAWPSTAFLGNFARIWTNSSFPIYFLNSIVVTGTSIACILVLGSMAAYALARYRFRANAFLYLFFLAGLMLPLRLAIIPLFVEMRELGVLDSRWSLIFTYTAMGLPSAVFILTGFLRTLPAELEEAARIDGASEARIMCRVMLPLTRPALVIAGIYNAIPIWNDFFFPLIFIQSDSRKTLPQGLTAFMGEYTTDWGMLFAGLTVAVLPVAVIYAVLSRSFIAGMTAGAVK